MKSFEHSAAAIRWVSSVPKPDDVDNVKVMEKKRPDRHVIAAQSDLMFHIQARTMRAYVKNNACAG